MISATAKLSITVAVPSCREASSRGCLQRPLPQEHFGNQPSHDVSVLVAHLPAQWSSAIRVSSLPREFQILNPVARSSSHYIPITGSGVIQPHSRGMHSHSFSIQVHRSYKVHCQPCWGPKWAADLPHQVTRCFCTLKVVFNGVASLRFWCDSSSKSMRHWRGPQKVHCTLQQRANAMPDRHRGIPDVESQHLCLARIVLPVACLTDCQSVC